jgi:hypothetical protein
MAVDHREVQIGRGYVDDAGPGSLSHHRLLDGKRMVPSRKAHRYEGAVGWLCLTTSTAACGASERGLRTFRKAPMPS